MRIEILGIIGSGKSSLAKLLLETGYSVVFEEFKLNPFWKAFYSNPNKYNFETEVTFLLQHYHELKRKREEEDNIVCDFSFTQDLAYAVMGLKDTQLNIFRSIYNYILNELGEPTLIIYLKCSPEEAVRRIKARGRKEEELIDARFLGSLATFIKDEIEIIRSEKPKVKVIEIDTEQANIMNNSNDCAIVIADVTKALNM